MQASKAAERANLKLLRRLTLFMSAVRTVPYVSSFGFDRRVATAEMAAEKAGASLAEALTTLMELRDKEKPDIERNGECNGDGDGDDADADPMTHHQHHQNINP